MIAKVCEIMELAIVGHHSSNKSRIIDYSLGFVVGATLTLPLLGRVVGIPASAFSLFLPLVSLALCLASRLVLSRIQFLVSGLFIVYFILVLHSAHAAQFMFFLDPSKWLQNSDYYFESKLLKVAIAGVPGALAVACFVMALGEQKFKGLRDAIIVAAVLALLNLLRFSDVLIGTSYEEAAKYFRHPYTMGHSAVLYGVLMCIGTAAAMTTRIFWLLSSLFLVALFLIGRRVELIVAVLVTLAFCGLAIVQNRSARNLNVWRFVPIFIIAGTLSAFSHNEVTTTRWAHLSEGATERTDMISSTLRAEENSENRLAVKNLEKKKGSGEESKLNHPAEKQSGLNKIETATQQNEPSEAIKFLFGQGLGWYYTLRLEHPYPHNYLLSTYFESGAIASFVVLLIVGIGITLPLLAGRLTSFNFMLVTIIGSMFVTSLKAGDETFGIRVLCFAMLSAALSQGSCGRVLNQDSDGTSPLKSSDSTNEQ